MCYTLLSVHWSVFPRNDFNSQFQYAIKGLQVPQTCIKWLMGISDYFGRAVWKSSDQTCLTIFDLALLITSKFSQHSLAGGSHCLMHSAWSAVLGCSIYSLCHYELLWSHSSVLRFEWCQLQWSLNVRTLNGFDTVMEIMSCFRFSLCPLSFKTIRERLCFCETNMLINQSKCLE